MKQLLYPFRRSFLFLFSYLLLSTQLSAQVYQSFQSDGAAIYYRSYGDGEITVVLSGGPGISSEQIVDMAEKVGETQQAILLDQRGTGKSVLDQVNPNTLNLDLMVEDLENLRRALKTKRITIVGHSWGAMYAMLYAKAYPKRVEKLVLVSTGGVNMEFYGRYRKNLLASYTSQELTRLKYLNQLRRAGRADDKFDREFRTLEYKARIYDKSQLEAYSAILYKGKFQDQVLQQMLAEIQEHYDVKSAFPEFEQEVLIIQGKQTPIGEETALEVLANFPNARIKWIHECGHFPWIEQPQAFYEALTRFLE